MSEVNEERKKQRRLQRRLLQSRKLYPTPGGLSWQVLPPEDERKTLSMRLLEAYFERPLEEIIREAPSDARLARELGVHPTTLSRWRNRLGLPPKGPGPRRQASRTTLRRPPAGTPGTA